MGDFEFAKSVRNTGMNNSFERAIAEHDSNREKWPENLINLEEEMPGSRQGVRSADFQEPPLELQELAGRVDVVTEDRELC